MVKYKIKTQYCNMMERVEYVVYRKTGWLLWDFMDYRKTKEQAENLIAVLKKELDND